MLLQGSTAFRKMQPLPGFQHTKVAFLLSFAPGRVHLRMEGSVGIQLGPRQLVSLHALVCCVHKNIADSYCIAEGYAPEWQPCSEGLPVRKHRIG